MSEENVKADSGDGGIISRSKPALEVKCVQRQTVTFTVRRQLSGGSSTHNGQLTNKLFNS